MKVLKSKAKKLLSKNSRKKSSPAPALPSQKQEITAFHDIDDNFAFLDELLGNAIGLVKQKYCLGDDKTEIGIAYIANIANTEFISSQVVEPLLSTPFDLQAQNNILSLIECRFILIPGSSTSSQMKDIIDGLLQGNSILFINGITEVIIISSAKFEKRSIEKPDNEPSLFGSMDSFTEDLDTNCSLIMRRLPTPDLRFEVFEVGRLSHTKVKLLWIENIADNGLIEEVRRRIKNIDIDIVPGIGLLSKLIEDSPQSVFPKFKQSQRPDLTVKYLADGHFALLCSNSPYSFLAPVTLWDHFKTADDYADGSLTASYLRILRFIAFLLSLLISPLYLAFVAYHHAVVPPALALNIATGRQGVPPFPSVGELLLLTIIIGIIREAGLRIPSTVGFFVGVLGAVVIGQSAVTAGYVSASVIIVVAISAIASFGFSSNIMVAPSRLINYFLIILAGFLGMFGLINGVAIILWHVVCQKSFGVPYLYPLVPFDPEAMKDTLVRLPYSELPRRFGILTKDNSQRIIKQAANNNSDQEAE